MPTPQFETSPWRWTGFEELPWLLPSVGFSFVLEEGEERYRLTLGDLSYREEAASAGGGTGDRHLFRANGARKRRQSPPVRETEGLFVGFDRRTGWGEWRSPGGTRVEAGVHLLQYPGEPAWYVEVEFRAPGGRGASERRAVSPARVSGGSAGGDAVGAGAVCGGFRQRPLRPAVLLRYMVWGQ